MRAVYQQQVWFVTAGLDLTPFGCLRFDEPILITFQQRAQDPAYVRLVLHGKDLMHRLSHVADPLAGNVNSNRAPVGERRWASI